MVDKISKARSGRVEVLQVGKQRQTGQSVLSHFLLRKLKGVLLFACHL